MLYPTELVGLDVVGITTTGSAVSLRLDEIDNTPAGEKNDPKSIGEQHKFHNGMIVSLPTLHCTA